MFGRLFRKKTYTRDRARALTAQFLRQHMAASAARIHAWDLPEHFDENDAGRAPDGSGPDTQTAADRYIAYAVFLAIHVYGQCSPLLPQTGDEDEGISFAGTVLMGGLGVGPEVARDLFFSVLGKLPRTDDGQRLDLDEIEGLPDAERRSVMLWEIAANDAAVVVRAFADGRTTVDLSNHDFEPLAEWLESPAGSDGARS